MSIARQLRMDQFINRTRGSMPEEAWGYFPFLKERVRQRAGTLSGGEQEMLASPERSSRLWDTETLTDYLAVGREQSDGKLGGAIIHLAQGLG
jgi:hypothetical protein